MPIYPPRNTATRKAGIFEYKMFEFLRCLEDECSAEKLFAKAENVRIAKLNLLKARLATMKSYSAADESEKQLRLKEKINDEVIKWKSMTHAEIEKYCLKNYNS